MQPSSFWRGAITDPRTQRASSARIAGLVALATACLVAIVGIATRQDVSGIVTALVAGGAVPILSRVKACQPAGGADGTR